MQTPNPSFSQLAKSLDNCHHISLVVHPKQYLKGRTKSLRDLVEVVTSSRVSIRGWDMPHVDKKLLDLEPDAVTSAFASDRYLEGWRAHKSLQFEFLELCSEEDPDYQKKLRDHWGLDDETAKFYLDWGNVVFSFCEYFEFARRFALNGNVREGVVVEISYRNMLDVGISSSDFDRNIWHFEPAMDREISIKRTLGFESVGESSTLAAREAVTDFFKYFRMTVRPDILKQMQEKFFNLRIGTDRNLPPVE